MYEWGAMEACKKREGWRTCKIIRGEGIFTSYIFGRQREETVVYYSRFAADGRWRTFSTLKLPPYRFSFKKSAIHPGGGIWFFFKKKVLWARFFDFAIQVLHVGQVCVRFWCSAMHATGHVCVAAHANPEEIVLGQLCLTSIIFCKSGKRLGRCHCHVGFCDCTLH